MNFMTETFLAQSRKYLLDADVQPQQDVRADLIARADQPGRHRGAAASAGRVRPRRGGRRARQASAR